MQLFWFRPGSLVSRYGCSANASRKDLSISLIDQLTNYFCALCTQVYKEISSLIETCRVQVKVAQLTSSMSHSDLVGPGSFLFTQVNWKG